MKEVTFTELCSGKKGCAYKLYPVMKKKTIAKAIGKVAEHIDDCFRKIAKHSVMSNFFIGKTYFKMIRDRWTTDGVLGAYRRHKGENREYMMVVAMITNECIPSRCRKDKYIIDAEEYANTLKTRLVQWFQENPKMKNDPTGSSGRKKPDASGYVIYIAFGN